jgi:c(7)-type cytochrome triheme protein
VGLWIWTAATAAQGAQEARGYDHEAHARALANKHGTTIACDDCHRASSSGKLALVGRNHEPCKRSGCHAPWPLRPSRAQFDSLCLTCHSESSFQRGNARVVYPPYSLSPDHATVFSHAGHARAAGDGGCATCHDPRKLDGSGRGPEGRPGGDPHANCSGCHAAKVAKLTMRSCGGCHAARSSLAAGKTQLATGEARRNTEANRYSVAALFSHTGHGRKVTTPEGRRCGVCHGNVLTATAPPRAPVALPTMQQCADSCHDGRKAFSAVGTTCYRCHQPAATGGAR